MDQRQARRVLTPMSGWPRPSLPSPLHEKRCSPDTKRGKLLSPVIYAIPQHIGGAPRPPTIYGSHRRRAGGEAARGQPEAALDLEHRNTSKPLHAKVRLHALIYSPKCSSPRGDVRASGEGRWMVTARSLAVAGVVRRRWASLGVVRPPTNDASDASDAAVVAVVADTALVDRRQVGVVGVAAAAARGEQRWGLARRAAQPAAAEVAIPGVGADTRLPSLCLLLSMRPARSTVLLGVLETAPQGQPACF